MLITNIFVILMFVVLGVVFATGKGADLVAGYNTMPKEEKEKIDKKALCKYMTALMFILAACWAIFAVGMEISKMWLVWCGSGLFLVAIIVFLVLLNTGNRLEKKD